MMEAQVTKVTTRKSDVKSLRDMCRLHPNDPLLRQRLGEALMEQGREVAGMMALREAYRLLRKDNPLAAGRLVERFGEDVAMDAMRPAALADYLPLAGHFGRLARHRRTVRLKEGEPLFREGEEADAAYLLLDGEMAITVAGGGQPVLLNYLHAGALLGEGALIDGAKRTASATANAPSTLLRFEPEELKRALGAHPELNLRFAKESQLRRRMAMLSLSPAFARLPMDVRFLVARSVWEQRHRAREVIKEWRTVLPYVAILAEGVVNLYEGGLDGVYCGRMRHGALIGVHRWSDYDAMAITIVAETDSVLLCMPSAVIEDVMDVSPWFASQVAEAGHVLAERIHATVKLQREGG